MYNPNTKANKSFNKKQINLKGDNYLYVQRMMKCRVLIGLIVAYFTYAHGATMNCQPYEPSDVQACTWGTSERMKIQWADQNCPAGWAYAVSSAVEMLYAEHDVTFPDFVSAQQLIDCNELSASYNTCGPNYGASGKRSDFAVGGLKYIRDKYFMCTASVYPVTGHIQHCQDTICDPSKPGTVVLNVDVQTKYLHNPEELVELLKQSPGGVIMSIDTSSMGDYVHGDGAMGMGDVVPGENYLCSSVSPAIFQDVLVIGFIYQASTGKGEIIFKNSWGVNWGEFHPFFTPEQVSRFQRGYGRVKISRNYDYNNERRNPCRIFPGYATYPVLK